MPGIAASTVLTWLFGSAPNAVEAPLNSLHRRVDGADLAVRLGAERGRGAAEQLGLGDYLGVDFEADHDLPRAGAAL
jgi:hypothetical protein